MTDPKKGLYDKFAVFRVPGDAKGGVTPVGGCFVLRPEDDEAALAALAAYADHEEVKGTKLSQDLKRWIARIERPEEGGANGGD